MSSISLLLSATASTVTPVTDPPLARHQPPNHLGSGAPFYVDLLRLETSLGVQATRLGFDDMR